MSNPMEDKEYAFPIHPMVNSQQVKHYKGMTLLDYFAGQALTRIIGVPTEEQAKGAYEIAAAMIRERRNYE